MTEVRWIVAKVSLEEGRGSAPRGKKQGTDACVGKRVQSQRVFVQTAACHKKLLAILFSPVFCLFIIFFIRSMIGVYRNWSVAGEYGQVYGDGTMSKLLMGSGGGSGGRAKDTSNNPPGKK